MKNTKNCKQHVGQLHACGKRLPGHLVAPISPGCAKPTSHAYWNPSPQKLLQEILLLTPRNSRLHKRGNQERGRTRNMTELVLNSLKQCSSDVHRYQTSYLHTQ